MYNPPAYLWAITIAGPTGIAAATCIVLYGGAERAGLGRRRAALLAGAAAVLLGGWFTVTALIADHGWYHTLPWYPVAAAGFLGTLLALSRIPVVARALTAPGMASRLVGPRSLRVAGVGATATGRRSHDPLKGAEPHDQDDSPARTQRAVRLHLHPWAARPAPSAGAHRHLPRPPGRGRQIEKGDPGWLTSTPGIAACWQPTRLATPQPWLRWRGRCMASWPRRPPIWARCGPGSGFMRPHRASAAGGGRPREEPRSATARRLRSRAARPHGRCQ